MTITRRQSVLRHPQPDQQALLETWEWQARGACRGVDLELFFPPDETPPRERARREHAAKRICGECGVRALCLAQALRLGEPFGVWGGTTPEERRLP